LPDDKPKLLTELSFKIEGWLILAKADPSQYLGLFTCMCTYDT
jgi:hypothetical protein